MLLDSRFEKLAAGLTGFSTSLAKGERVLIDAFDVPDAMVIALVRAARARGALPYVQLHRARITRELMLEATEAQLARFPAPAPTPVTPPAPASASYPPLEPATR